MKQSSKKLYKVKKLRKYSIDEKRKGAIAHSNGCLYLGSVNEKTFNFEKIKDRNDYNKNTKKSDYNGAYLTRHDETDRMKKERFIGKKKLRNHLKRVTLNEIRESLE